MSCGFTRRAFSKLRPGLGIRRTVWIPYAVSPEARFRNYGLGLGSVELFESLTHIINRKVWFPNSWCSSSPIRGCGFDNGLRPSWSRSSSGTQTLGPNFIKMLSRKFCLAKQKMTGVTVAAMVTVWYLAGNVFLLPSKSFLCNASFCADMLYGIVSCCEEEDDDELMQFLPIFFPICVAGVNMIPISWCEMVCPKSHAKEYRKVARVQSQHIIQPSGT